MNGSYSRHYSPMGDLDREILIRNVSDHLLNMRPDGMIKLLPAALAAIDCANVEYWEDFIDLPEGYTIRGRSSVPAGILIANLNLGKFVDID